MIIVFQIQVVAFATIRRIERPSAVYTDEIVAEQDSLTSPQKEFATGPPSYRSWFPTFVVPFAESTST